MGMNESEIYRLLNLAEDYVLDGFRHAHPPPASGPAVGSEPSTASDSPPASPAETSPEALRRNLDDIARTVAACTACALHRERRNTVAGEGAVDPLVMIIGEGPGAEEDRSGKPKCRRFRRILPSIGPFPCGNHRKENRRSGQEHVCSQP